jgi:hypothetical protein
MEWWKSVGILDGCVGIVADDAYGRLKIKTALLSAQEARNDMDLALLLQLAREGCA